MYSEISANESITSDDGILEQIFRCIRLQGCVYFARELHTPWGMEIGAGAHAQFHAVVEGQCVLCWEGEEIPLQRDDIVLFPTGQRHALADAPNSRRYDGADVLQSFAQNTPLFQSGGSPTKLICGHYEYRTELSHPFIEQLPRILILNNHREVELESRRSTVQLVCAEAARTDASAAMIDRLAEVLLIQTLRAYVGQSGCPRFLSGLNDRRIAKALRLIHKRFGERLTLDKIAAAATMSRSAFAATFRGSTGVAPIEYLTKWRMLSALELLEVNRLSVAQVALQVGYASESAFSRAFKRQIGTSPSEYRDQKLGEGLVAR